MYTTEFTSWLSNLPSEKSMLQDMNANNSNSKKISAVFDNRWLNAHEVIWTPFGFSRQHFKVIGTGCSVPGIEEQAANRFTY